MNEQTSQATEANPPPPGPLAALAITLVVVIGIVLWLVLSAKFVSPPSLFGAFLMLWYWAAVEQLSPSRLPASLLGALVGIGLAWFLLYATVNLGGLGVVAAILALMLAIFLDVRRAVPLVVNPATMLYLTIAAAPLIQLKVNWIELCISTVVGGLFFAGFVEGVKRLAARFASGNA